MQYIFLIIIILTAVLAIYFSCVGGIKMLRFFMFLVVFQNFIVIIFTRYIPTQYNTYFTIIKELMLYFSLFAGIIKSGYIRNLKIKTSKKSFLYSLPLIVYILFVFKNLLITSAGLSSAILSARYLLLPVLCIYVGKTLDIDAKQIKQLFKEIVICSLFLALFGFFELLVLKDDFWIKLNYGEYAIRMKGNNPWELIINQSWRVIINERGVTKNFYTWDFFGKHLRRLVSITADPLATAYLIYLGSMILFIGVIPIRRYRSINLNCLVELLLIFAAILSLSKAIFLMIAVTLIICAHFYNWLPKRLVRIITVLIGVLGAVYVIRNMGASGKPTSIYMHVSGLMNGIANSGLFGSGLGTAGSSVAMYTGAESGINESYIGAMMYQIGIIGTFCFFVFLIIILVKLHQSYNTNKNPITVFSISALIGIVLCMLFSDSSVSIMGTGLFFILIGLSQKRELLEGEFVHDYN